MRRAIFLLLLFVLFAAASPDAWAHGVQGRDADFLKSVTGPYPGPFMYLGAKHMVTGYDHLLFLVGVIFFLYRMRDVAIYVTCFAVGHSVTLLTGVLSGINVNPYLVDALIGVSVIYKAFDNLDGFKTLLGWQPNTKAAVLGFGLIHGFGLATKIQEFKLPSNGLVTNMISFNVGVELGQLVALSIILMAMILWRRTDGFLRHANFANVLLMTAGFVLMGYQLTGYILGPAV
jgi:hypothetical protein